MAGMPPTAGLTGKLLLIGGGLQAGAGGLIATLIVSTAISAYAYLRVVLAAFRPAGAGRDEATAAAMAPMGGGDGTDAPSPWSSAWIDVGLGVVLVTAVAGTLALGVFPETLLSALEGLLPPR